MKNKFVILYFSHHLANQVYFDQWDLAYDRFKSICSCPNCRAFYLGKLNNDSSKYLDIYFPANNVNDLRKKWWRTND